ncbi:ATP-binding protein [Massilia sp. erpn]|uniref:ATP-binding protein n=1 Tax=Massilia sp. erpn TaxID=2738142 RepID=UPI002107DE5D|nr:ATP-binding protein [Massilia sp. erpn]UTY56871.1 PAS domain-containing protein [Massilia sp. erpn]
MGALEVIDTRTLTVADEVAHKWQGILDLIARLVQVPAALIMKVEPPQIKVFLSSHSDGNPYEEHELAPLGTGLYCETVMARRAPLLVPNALGDSDWCENPDIKLGMISYMGLPLVWPNDHVFGTICVLDRQENAYSNNFLQLLQQFRGIVENDLKQIYDTQRRSFEDAALRADEAERVRREFIQLRAGEQRALAALQESERRWHFALEGAGDGVWDWDLPKDTVFYSKRCVELLGLPPERAVHRFGEWQQYIHPEDLAAAMAAIDVGLQSPAATFASEHRFRVQDKWEWLLVRGMVVSRNALGQPLRMIGTCSNITLRKQAQVDLQALNEHLEERVAERSAELQKAMEQIAITEKMASLGRLVAGIAHELNTPVGNAVLTSSTLVEWIGQLERQAASKQLTHSALDEFLQQGKAACELIERNATRASNLIASFKQIAVDQSTQQRREFELHQAVHDVVAALGPSLRRARIELQLDVAPGIAMDSYPGHIEQIIANLAANSITHAFNTKDEERRVRLSASASEDEVELVYEDNGCGIDPAIQPHVFEPFYTTRLGQGSNGLGLSIVHNIAQAVLKGSIHLESEPDQGVRFRFRLPRRLA